MRSVALVVEGRRRDVPLSQRVKFIENPKSKGSKSWQRYERYKAAGSLREALDLGAVPGDLLYDYKKKFFKLLDFEPGRRSGENAADGQGASQRPRPAPTFCQNSAAAPRRAASPRRAPRSPEAAASPRLAPWPPETAASSGRASSAEAALFAPAAAVAGGRRSSGRVTARDREEYCKLITWLESGSDPTAPEQGSGPSASSSGPAEPAPRVHIRVDDDTDSSSEDEEDEESGAAATSAGSPVKGHDRGRGQAGEEEDLAAWLESGAAGSASADAEAEKPFSYVLSLGSRCVVARLLRETELRQYAGPFDWLYSTAEMVRDCLSDDFASLLDLAQIPERADRQGEKVGWGHKKYGKMLGRSVIFPHHKPRDKDREFFQRAVERFREILRSQARKLFVVAYPVIAVSQAVAVRSGRTGSSNSAEVKRLFRDLRERGVANFELMAVYLMQNKASKAHGGRGAEPQVRTIHDSGPGAESMRILELHCTGRCTGLYFKEDADEQAMRKLLKRHFELEPDPLPPRLGGAAKGPRLMGEVLAGPASQKRRRPSAASKLRASSGAALRRRKRQRGRSAAASGDVAAGSTRS